MNTSRCGIVVVRGREVRFSAVKRYAQRHRREMLASRTGPPSLLQMSLDLVEAFLHQMSVWREYCFATEAWVPYPVDGYVEVWFGN